MFTIFSVALYLEGVFSLQPQPAIEEESLKSEHETLLAENKKLKVRIFLILFFEMNTFIELKWEGWVENNH